MKTRLLEWLICPACLPDERSLQPKILEAEKGDILTGALICPDCGARFSIEAGIAHLDPARHGPNESKGTDGNKYERQETVHSYLWSHYGELLNDDNASGAYEDWANRMQPHQGVSLDVGGAVGRFTFEMSTRCDMAIGIDSSLAFVRAARRLMNEGEIPIELKEEGFLSHEKNLILPETWKNEKVEFIVGNALALPFRREVATSAVSLNLVDKVPSPMGHLREMNRVTKNQGAQFLLSDPFSWSTDAADVDEWLGGKLEGPYAGKGLDNIAGLLEGRAQGLEPPWRLDHRGSVWWTIRTHSNHYERIRSCFLKASR